VSAFNTTVQDLRHSYKEGQRVAHLHQIQDYETTVRALQDRPDDLARFQKHAEDPLLMRELWHAMFLSGMLPFEHYDRSIMEAHAAGTPIFCVDMPNQQCEQLAECAFLHVVQALCTHRNEPACSKRGCSCRRGWMAGWA
jgi:hypothetical protein